MNFPIFRYTFFLISFVICFAPPQVRAVSDTALLYENGKKITDDTVISAANGGTICEHGCCPFSDAFYQAPVSKVLSYDEWTDHYLLGVAGCEDRVTKTDEDNRQATSEWHLKNIEWMKDKTQEEIDKSYNEFMIAKGFTSYAYPRETCTVHPAQYEQYLEKYKRNAKYSMENVQTPIMIRKNLPEELYPIQIPQIQKQGYAVKMKKDNFDFLNNKHWIKVDIATGTIEVITIKMRKELQKLIDAGLEYAEIMDRMCREDFLKDQPSPSYAPLASTHSTAPEPTSDTAIPIAPLVAGVVFVLLLTGTLLMISQKKGKSIKK